MSKDIIHISIRADERTLDQIEEDLLSIPTEDPGFAFKINYGEYEFANGNKQKTIILDPENVVTDVQAKAMFAEFMDFDEYEFAQVVLYCVGERSGIII